MKKYAYVILIIFYMTILISCGHTSSENIQEIFTSQTEEHCENGKENVDIQEEMNSREVVCLGKGSYLSFLYYNCYDNSASLKYNAADGEWNRPLGIYSFETSRDIIFVDDSANNRIAVVESNKTKYILIPENYVCTQMKYMYSENKLLIILLDNLAVEPQNLWYVEKVISDSEMIITLDDLKPVEFDCVLIENGQLDEEPVLAYRSFDWDRYTKELDGYLITASDRGNLKYMDQYNGCQLWKYTPQNTTNLCYFIVYDNDIIAYTEMLDGEHNMGINARLKEDNGYISIVWMEVASEHELLIKESKSIVLINE